MIKSNNAVKSTVTMRCIIGANSFSERRKFEINCSYFLFNSAVRSSFTQIAFCHRSRNRQIRHVEAFFFSYISYEFMKNEKIPAKNNQQIVDCKMFNSNKTIHAHQLFQIRFRSMKNVYRSRLRWHHLFAIHSHVHQSVTGGFASWDCCFVSIYLLVINAGHTIIRILLHMM